MGNKIQRHGKSKLKSGVFVQVREDELATLEEEAKHFREIYDLADKECDTAEKQITIFEKAFIEIEKTLCKILGREWHVAVSVESLCEEIQKRMEGQEIAGHLKGRNEQPQKTKGSACVCDKCYCPENGGLDV